MLAARRSFLLIGLLVGACSAPSPTATVAPDPTPRPTPVVTAQATASAEASASPGPMAIAEDPRQPGPRAGRIGLDAPIGIARRRRRPSARQRAGRSRPGARDDDGSHARRPRHHRPGRSGGERGLLGLVLHPACPTAPRAFVHYTGARWWHRALRDHRHRRGRVRIDSAYRARAPGGRAAVLEPQRRAARVRTGRHALPGPGRRRLGRRLRRATGRIRRPLLGTILRLDVVARRDALRHPRRQPVRRRRAVRRGLRARPPQPLALQLRPPRPGSSGSPTSGRTAYEEIDRRRPGPMPAPTWAGT